MKRGNSTGRIEYGDRIFARLTMAGRTVVEIMLDRVSDMTELIGEMRHASFGLKGLAKLYIRNHSKGWSNERPLMLYSPDFGRSAEAISTMGSACFAPVMPQRTIFPWDTH